MFLFSALLAEVLRLAWWPGPVDLTAEKPAPHIVMAAFPRSGAGDAGWAPLRAEVVLARQLEYLGLSVERRTGGTPIVEGVDGVLTGRLDPASIDADLDPLVLRMELKTSKGTVQLTAKGVARDFDQVLARLAIDVGRHLGLDVRPDAEPLLADIGHAFSVHRFLGRAELRLERGADRQAAVMFDRARTFRASVFVPEAIEGQRRAEGALLAHGASSGSSRTALASSAAERAEVDGRRGRYADAERGWTSFLRYTDRRARRWSMSIPLGERPTIVGRKNHWLVQDQVGRNDRLTFDPRTGTVLGRDPAIRGLIGATDDHFLTMRAGRLSRLDERLRPRWDVKLPVRVTKEGLGAVELTSGLLGVKGDSAVVWLEVSFGKVGQLALEVVPLASSPGGVVVLARPKGQQKTLDVALLRPGKRTPAWRTPVDSPREALMTRDVVMLTTPEGLVLLRTYNGQPVKAPLALESSARLIGAYGRYGCVGYDAPTVAVIDIVAGEQTALVRGPARAVACDTTSDGVVILYASGDVIFYDRDGKLLDRARVDGTPIGIERGHPETPGPIVITSHGLTAFGEIPIDLSRLRDVDGMVALATILRINDNDAAALAVSTHVAFLSAGRIKEAETIRAELLEKQKSPAASKAAKWARARARAAADPTRSLPRFRLTGG